MTAMARRGTGRAPRRFSPMLHARPIRLAMTSVGLAAAAILGVQLGQSAISEINPVHFQGALAPQGITPPPEPAPYDPYAQQYVWSMNPPPYAVDCRPDCDGDRAEEAMRLALDQSAGGVPRRRRAFAVHARPLFAHRARRVADRGDAVESLT